MSDADAGIDDRAAQPDHAAAESSAGVAQRAPDEAPPADRTATGSNMAELWAATDVRILRTSRDTVGRPCIEVEGLRTVPTPFGRRIRAICQVSEI